MMYLYIVIGTCLAMIVKDFVAVYMTIAESRGNAKIAARLNPLGTIANVFFYSVGETALFHNYGWWGLPGLIPVLIVDYLDGYYFTKWGDSIKGGDEEDSDDAPSVA